jgi:hypothetical protein
VSEEEIDLAATNQTLVEIEKAIESATRKHHAFLKALGLSTQSVRNNLKKLESLEIFERFSEKQRDLHAIYRFRHG